MPHGRRAIRTAMLAPDPLDTLGRGDAAADAQRNWSPASTCASLRPPTRLGRSRRRARASGAVLDAGFVAEPTRGSRCVARVSAVRRHARARRRESDATPGGAHRGEAGGDAASRSVERLRDHLPAAPSDAPGRRRRRNGAPRRSAATITSRKAAVRLARPPRSRRRAEVSSSTRWPGSGTRKEADLKVDR